MNQEHLMNILDLHELNGASWIILITATISSIGSGIDFWASIQNDQCV